MKRRRFLWFKIIITISSFILAVIAKSNIDFAHLQNTYFEPSLAKEILYDFSVGIFASMVLVWCVDEIGEIVRTGESKKREISRIKGVNKVLQVYIDKYTVFYYCVVTPIENRDNNKTSLVENFMLSDMRDLYMQTLLITEEPFRSSIDAFYETETILRNELTRLVTENVFQDYQQIERIFTDFNYISISNDSRSAILGYRNETIGNRKLTDYIHDILKDGTVDKLYQDYLDGKDQSANLGHPFIILANMMKKERTLILQYQEEINKILAQ